MEKFADDIFENSDVFYNRYCKDKDCNRLQRNVSHDIYVPMENCTYSDRLANGTYENVDTFCNACRAYENNNSKRLYSDLSQDIYVPIEICYSFMDRLATCTYENGDVSCNIYNHTNKPIENITGENEIYKKEIVKKIKNIVKKKECQIKTEKSTNKKQLRPLSEGFNQTLFLETDAEDTKRCYSEIYDVPNTRPILPTKIQQNKESVFCSRSYACVSQNIRTYLKETKSAGIYNLM